MSMTKRDYVAIADVLRDARDVDDVRQGIANVCEAGNSQFDRQRFLEAATPSRVTYHVRDNVSGLRVSREFHTLGAAEAICRELNTPAAGGRYHVCDNQGVRV